MDNSLALLRTNVGLTTNIKIMISSSGLYLESIDSRSELSNVVYKKFYFDKNSYYDDLLPLFYNGLNETISYHVKDDNDNDIMFTDFSKQFDDIYYSGCRNITNNKAYTEEFECFSPLYIKKDKLPQNFIVFRIDGPGLLKLDKDNFQTEILDNLKVVKVFDLSMLSDIGYWLNINYVNNKNFPDCPFYMDFRDLEFSYWNGISYQTGGYTKLGIYLDSFLDDENTFSDFEKYIYDGYNQNSIIFPHIINLSFLFDDVPATPSDLKNWSINRYMGYYLNTLDLYKSVNAYILPQLNNDVIITNGNILVSPSLFNPFIQIYDNIQYPYVEINGSLYTVEKIEVSHENILEQKIKINNNLFVDGISTVHNYIYKIISDIDYSGLTLSSINNNSISFTNSNILYLDNMNNLIPDYDKASVWIIEIDHIYHRIISNNDNTYTLLTDYSFEKNDNQLNYWINYPQQNKNTIYLEPNLTNLPLPFNIYKCNFTDIVDFETSVVNTPFSKYEYENNTSINKTDEPKMFRPNYDSLSNPVEKDQFIINSKNVNIPCSSEYTANGELFSLANNNLNSLWKKNPQRVKWGYMGSKSANDYPYLLNNSFLAEMFNKTTSTIAITPNRSERNLDYFYSINPSTQSYDFFSLNIYDGSPTFSFSFSDYITGNYDYFDYFFTKKTYFSNGNYCLNSEKYSLFNYSNVGTQNSTLFRGIKFNIYDIASIKTTQNSLTSINNIQSINAICNNSYYNWKFSILFSQNNESVSSKGINSYKNKLSWKIIKNLDNGLTYSNGDIINYYDVLYQNNIDNYVYNIYNNSVQLDSNWSLYNQNSLFWIPNKTNPSYITGDFVYNFGEFYTYVTQSGVDFWYPGKTYSLGDTVLYQKNLYTSTTLQSNNFFVGNSNYWKLDNKNSLLLNWKLITLWSVNNNYYNGDYTVYNNILYQKKSNIIDRNTHDISINWEIIYELYPVGSYVPQSGYVYDINNTYYLCCSNDNNSSMSDGIDIYVNYDYQNILINIYNNDNTLPYISNADRDLLYNNLYNKLCSTNFINYINNPSYYYGFSNLLRYIIIKNGSYNIYDINSINDLSVYINCETSDNINCRVNSIKIDTNSISTSQIKLNYILNNNIITTYSELNYYNNESFANVINRTVSPQLIPNYHGLKNIIYNSIYRYSGPYSPILYKIQLFKNVSENNTFLGNYVFDTELTDFGIAKELIISKVNRNQNILKLGNNLTSIYPMVDEFGYTTNDIFIFKSSWDFDFYLECILPNNIKQTYNNNLS